MDAVTISQVETSTDVDTVRCIIREYESWLGLDLCFQGFEDELANLPGDYTPPGGRLFLARYFDPGSSTATPVEYPRGGPREVAGCIALRPLESGVCEMKRLFVREEYRGMKIGKALIDRLIEDAKAIGYTAMRLDTYPPKMGKAVRLYESYGFQEIAPYYNNPTVGVVFMELKLQ